MRSSQALQTVGGILGLGVAGVITTLLLTSSEDSKESVRFKRREEFVSAGQHVPVTLRPEDSTADPIPIFEAGTTFYLVAETPLLPDVPVYVPPDEPLVVTFRVFLNIVNLITNPSDPTLSKQNKFDAKLGADQRFPLNIEPVAGADAVRYAIVTVYGDRGATGRIYEASLLIGIKQST